MTKTSIKLALFRFSLITLFAFTQLSCSTETIENTFQNQNTTTEIIATKYNYSEDEIVLVKIINEYRKQVGLNDLELIDYISQTAEEHVLYMIANNFVSHDGFDKRADDLENILNAEKIGENIAYNYITPELALKSWLASPGHKANIEGDYTHFGISIRINPKDGKKYYTNIFTKIL